MESLKFSSQFLLININLLKNKSTCVFQTLQESELNESKLEGTKANEYRAKLESEMEVLLQEKASLNSLLADTKLQVSGEHHSFDNT